MKIFHAIKSFFHPRGPLPGSQKAEISLKLRLIHWAFCWLGGALMATAFPPLNFTLAVFVALTVLLLEARNRSPLQAAWCGWLWGMGYALCGFFWLREIHGAIPWMMMLVLGAYYIPVGWTAALANRYILLPPEVRRSGFTAQCAFRNFSLIRQLAWALTVACSLVLVEYLRHSVLPWNYLGVAFYRNSVLMQLVRFTGISGLSMLAALFNAALALAILTVAQKLPEQNRITYRRPWVLLIMLLVLALGMCAGVMLLRERRKEYAAFEDTVKLTLVQGNLSQRRLGGEDSAMEALNRYSALTRTQTGAVTDLVVWPETAVNYPLRGAAMVCALYRDEVRELSRLMKAPLLLGTLEFDMSQDPPGSLNSAVLTDTRDVLRYGFKDIYSKTHPVPFGEFIPMRRYLPGWLINLIDMKRDLTPGKSLAPIVLSDKVKLGVNICFEDVFAYISREEFMRDANILLVITNDAWYPTSSEPEQHLANAVARAIECGLPMVRCGNDSATCVITPGGEIIWSLAETLKFGDGKPFRRGSGAATVTVKVPRSGALQATFYSRFGDWLVGAAAVIYLAMLLFMWHGRLQLVKKTQEKL
ncbi:MAG: apolipoprotein N-acyltransferase [Lentisphaerae bacterium]|nr:apolipoprotein N-acyltransferase [Lentisphaerota bacterium]